MEELSTTTVAMATTGSVENAIAIGLVFIGAAIAAALAFAGSSMGMGYAGQSGSGVISERPELFGKVLLMQALPGSQGIYGFVAAFFILIFSGILAQEATGLTVGSGLQYLAAGIPIGIAGLFSGMFQGKVSAAGISMIAKDESLTGKAILLSAIVETWAIFGFLITFILLINIS